MDSIWASSGGASRALAKGQLKSALHTSENTVMALLQSSSQAILGVDEQGRIVLTNTRTEEIFGYTADELIGAPIESLLPPSVRGVHTRHRTEYFTRPRVRPMGIGMELSGLRKDGAEFPVEVSLSNVQTEEGLFAIAFVTDITQRKRMEEQLLHSQKMEAVGRLAGGVAHDFNNMLTIIAGYNRMILDRLSPQDSLSGYAEEVLKAADRATALTQQLLAFSRRQIMKPRVIDANALILTTEKMLRRLIGEDIDLAINLAPGVGNIRVDPGHLEQAVFNLAANARDAMPGGGRLIIETGSAHLDETYVRTHAGVRPGDYVMIAVSDNGLGMDAETKRHIFEPFFTTKEAGKGTGLGLATVYGIVKQSGGDIWVYSEPAKGTTFKMYFPVVAEAAETAEGGATRPQSRGTETILLAEDEDGVRTLASTMLEQRGYTVLKAKDAREALEIAAAHRGDIALLVTDVIMPNKSGRQLAEELLRSRPSLKVLFLSGYTENTVVHHGVLEEGVDFLAKPFSHDTLARTVREILDRD
jgi:PAS domain S-box-containing protein